jgi:hypothetical protein
MRVTRSARATSSTKPIGGGGGGGDGGGGRGHQPSGKEKRTRGGRDDRVAAAAQSPPPPPPPARPAAAVRLRTAGRRGNSGVNNATSGRSDNDRGIGDSDSGDSDSGGRDSGNSDRGVEEVVADAPSSPFRARLAAHLVGLRAVEMAFDVLFETVGARKVRHEQSLQAFADVLYRQVAALTSRRWTCRGGGGGQGGQGGRGGQGGGGGRGSGGGVGECFLDARAIFEHQVPPRVDMHLAVPVR